MAIVLGIDYGEKRVGLAISAEDGTFAFPLALLANTNELVREVASVVRERNVHHIVMGASENPQGGDNLIKERITLCADALKRATGVAVELVPESFSSAEARRAFEVLALSRATSLPAVDAAAAAIILQSYLDKSRAASSEAPAPVEKSVSGTPKLSIEEFKRIEVTLGKVLSAEPVPNTDKLLRLLVDFGEAAPRQVLSGIAPHVPDVATLVGRTFPFVTNLEPRVIRGLESQAMILAASCESGEFAFLEPSIPLPPGTRVV